MHIEYIHLLASQVVLLGITYGMPGSLDALSFHDSRVAELTRLTILRPTI